MNTLTDLQNDSIKPGEKSTESAVSSKPPAIEDYQKFFDYSPDALVGLDENGGIVLFNAKALELFGITNGGSQLPGIESMMPELPPVVNRSSRHSQGNLVIEGRKINAERFWVEVAFTQIEKQNDLVSILSLRDVTASYREKCLLKQQNTVLEKSNQELESLVRTDALTGLMNRRGLETILVREIEYAKRNQTDILVALIDLDNFKQINDSKGHANGDLVLKHVAQVLKEHLRAIDWIGRVGGDEFLVILPNTALSIGANVLERIRLALSHTPASSPWGDINVTASIGLIGLPGSIGSIEEILELTQVTLKNSKLRGKNCVTFQDDEKLLQLRSTDDCADLRTLIEGTNGFYSIAQTIIRLENETVVGYEMYSRGPHGPLALPHDFFRVAQENNITTLVDLHCLKVCLAAIRALPDDVTIHLNLFPSTLTEIKAENLLDMLYRAGPKKKFCIELSERKMMVDHINLCNEVRNLQRYGVRIALDDVGFGHSSLEMLFRLEPEIIKIDTSLIKTVSHNREQQDMVRKLIKLATTVGAQTSAEGIENREDYIFLRDLGIDYGQGWLWQRNTNDSDGTRV